MVMAGNIGATDTIRTVTAADYGRILAVADRWWGRPISHILHPNYCVHFGDTGFVAERGEGRGGEAELIGFLLGFISQSRPGWAHIHAVSVHPDHRGRGLARDLYERFFSVAAERGCDHVSALTGPGNRGSVAFHRAMGFDLVLQGAIDIDGIPAVKDYAGPGQHRVLFERGV